MSMKPISCTLNTDFYGGTILIGPSEFHCGLYESVNYEQEIRLQYLRRNIAVMHAICVMEPVAILDWRHE
jgi:hypothetical protein